VAKAIACHLLALAKYQWQGNVATMIPYIEYVLGASLEDTILAETKPIIEEMLVNPDIKALSIYLQLVREIRPLLLSLEEQFAACLLEDDWEGALSAAVKSTDMDCRERFLQSLQKLSSQEFLHFFNKLPFTLKQACVDFGVDQFFPEMTQEMAKITLVSQLKENIKNLFIKLNNFEANGVEVVDLTTKALLGLARSNESYADYNCPSGFHQLPGNIKGMLNNNTYSYVWDNKYADTCKLRKGGPLCLIKAMQSTQKPTREAAFAAVKVLVEDYLDYGRTSPHKVDIALVIYALSKAYYEHVPDKDEAAKTLREWWCDSQIDLDILSKSFTHKGYTASYFLKLA
jgi:hypothetical protein